MEEDPISSDIAILATGVLNAHRLTDTVRFLLDAQPLPSGASNPLDIRDTWTAARPGESKPAPSDWILYLADSLDILAATVIDNADTAAASDHNPVTATVSLAEDLATPDPVSWLYLLLTDD